MIIKLISVATIIFSCSYVGIKLSSALRLRIKLLGEMSAALSTIESYISTVKMPLNEIFQALSGIKGQTGEFFKSLVPGTSWKDQMSILNGLTAEDKKLLVKMSETLGSMDVAHQTKQISLTKNILDKTLSEAKTDLVTNSKVYRVMSFFVGVIISVLII